MVHDDLNAAAAAARSLASEVTGLNALIAKGVDVEIIRAHSRQLNDSLPIARSCIRTVLTELRQVRTNAIQLGDISAPTAHECAITMVYAFNLAHTTGIELLSRKRVNTWPDCDLVLAEIELESTKAKSSREKEQYNLKPTKIVEDSSDYKVSSDFRSVHWFGTDYEFTATQAACVRKLFEAYANKAPVLGQDSILESADSACSKLGDVFDKGKHPAWGTMIVAGKTKGAFQLAKPKI
jgi:hypothetical protein